MTLTLDELIQMVNAIYPDGKVFEYHNEPDGLHGDGLARFIAFELGETFVDGTDVRDQLEDAIHAMTTAWNELGAVREALIAEHAKISTEMKHEFDRDL